MATKRSRQHYYAIFPRTREISQGLSFQAALKELGSGPGILIFGTHADALRELRGLGVRGRSLVKRRRVKRRGSVKRRSTRNRRRTSRR
jgi:hypothetical protein